MTGAWSRSIKIVIPYKLVWIKLAVSNALPFMHIDSEVYFWKYAKTLQHPLIRENKILQQHYFPENIEQSLHRNGIDGCIAVTAEAAEVETRFLAELALTHPSIRGMIGWIDLYDPKAKEKIEEFNQYNPLRGYRIEFKKDQKLRADVIEMLMEYQYSLDFSLGNYSVGDDLKNWMNAYPDQQFILDDAGSPDAKQAPSKTWETRIRELSKHQNLSCKLSGLFTSGNRKSWKPVDFYPFLEILFDSFGTNRLLFASGWPFLLLSGLYVQWKSLLEKFMERYSLEDHGKIFGENAQRLYRL
jgi:L-fuconolactonase